jgi:hypothetical protein
MVDIFMECCHIAHTVYAFVEDFGSLMAVFVIFAKHEHWLGD